jgi:hypothetical protein
MKQLKPEKVIIVDIIIMGIISVYLLIYNIIISIYFHTGYLIKIIEFKNRYSLIFEDINTFIYFYFIKIECILKILFTIIIYIKYKITPKFYLINISQTIFSLLLILIFIFNLFVEYELISFLLIGISSILFQIFYINKCENKYLIIISAFLIPIIFTIIIICYLGVFFI